MQVVDAIELLLSGRETALSTAQTITRVHEPCTKNNGSDRFLVALWSIISSAAAESDDFRAKRLANLITALHELPDCKDARGGTVNIGGHVVWRDLPKWGWIFRDEGIPFDRIYSAPSGISTVVVGRRDDDEVSAKELLNATTFAAHVLAGLPAGQFAECGAMHSYASIALEMALELSHESRSNQTYTWELLVLPAVTWILIAGEKIHQLCHLSLPEASDGFTTHRNWPQTFCVERWSLWKQKMQQLVEPQGVEERYQGLARRAANKMNALDDH